jgi:hypothetical protein
MAFSFRRGSALESLSASPLGFWLVRGESPGPPRLPPGTASGDRWSRWLGAVASTVADAGRVLLEAGRDVINMRALVIYESMYGNTHAVAVAVPP